MSMPSLRPTEPFDLISEPDEKSRRLRDQLQQWALAAAMLSPHERALILAEELRQVATEAHEQLQGLLLLRRCLVVLMQASGTEAFAVPFEASVLASTVALRVLHDPDRMPGVLQLLLPGEGLVVVSSSAYAEAPAGYDSDGDTETQRLRHALEATRRLLHDQAGRDTVLALIDATLRS